MRAGIVAFTKLHTKAELFEGGIARGVTVAPVSTVADVLSLEQLAVRAYWDEIELPSGRTVRDGRAVRQGVGDADRVDPTGTRRR